MKIITATNAMNCHCINFVSKLTIYLLDQHQSIFHNNPLTLLILLLSHTINTTTHIHVYILHMSFLVLPQIEPCIT